MAYKPLKTDLREVRSDNGSFDGEDDMPRATWKRCPRNHLNTALNIFLTLAAVVTIIIASLILQTMRDTLREQQILNGQHTTSRAETLPTTYTNDRRFQTLDTEYDHLWNEWKGNAQLLVQGELPGEGMLLGSYSMFHQMHCLASLRRAIQTARSGQDPGIDYWDNEHWPHCLDYLRNTILCFADDTVEVAGVVDHKRLDFVDGTRVLRQCRSPAKMYERMREDEIEVEKANREDTSRIGH